MTINDAKNMGIKEVMKYVLYTIRQQKEQGQGSYEFTDTELESVFAKVCAKKYYKEVSVDLERNIRRTVEKYKMQYLCLSGEITDGDKGNHYIVSWSSNHVPLAVWVHLPY